MTPFLRRFWRAAKIACGAFAAAALLVILAGVYRFNFTDDDIYIQTESGAVVKYGGEPKTQ